MAGYLANLLPCHQGENRLLSTHRERISPLHRFMKAKEGNLPASRISPLSFQPLSSDVKYGIGCSKDSWDKRAKTVLSSLLQAALHSWATSLAHLRAHSPWGKSALQSAPEAKAPQTSQRHDEGRRGDMCPFSQGRCFPLSPPRQKKKKKKRLLIRTIGRHSVGVCVKHTNG